MGAHHATAAMPRRTAQAAQTSVAGRAVVTCKGPSRATSQTPTAARIPETR
jgi:hypothetical protein